MPYIQPELDARWISFRKKKKKKKQRRKDRAQDSPNVRYARGEKTSSTSLESKVNVLRVSNLRELMQKRVLQVREGNHCNANSQGNLAKLRFLR